MGESGSRRRRDHLAYYLRVVLTHDLPNYGIRRAWNHLWSARWYWSGGFLGPIPVGKTKDGWK